MLRIILFFIQNSYDFSPRIKILRRREYDILLFHILTLFFYNLYSREFIVLPFHYYFFYTQKGNTIASHE